jgi:ferredoxin/flavodoxin---NADP+ reductase
MCEAAPDGPQYESDAATPRPDAPSPAPALDDVDQTEGMPPQDTGPLQVRVVARQAVAEHNLMFKLERPPSFTFQPGQYVRLQLDGIRRNYSIVSAPHEPFLEFFVDLVPAGRMSARLGALRVGQAVTLASGARGRFTMDDSLPQHVMVATGAGIAPFVSMLRAHLAAAEQRHRFHVFHGVSYRDEFGYDHELDRMATTHPQWMTYVPTVSRPEEPRNAAWTGATGRVHTLIEPYFQQTRLSSETTILYACGNANIIRAVQQQFAPRGFTVHTERFWS